MADARLSAGAEEVITDGTPSEQLSSVASEVITNGSPEQRLAAISVEVLAPSQLVTAFIGWGIPLS